MMIVTGGVSDDDPLFMEDKQDLLTYELEELDLLPKLYITLINLHCIALSSLTANFHFFKGNPPTMMILTTDLLYLGKGHDHPCFSSKGSVKFQNFQEP